MKNKLALYALMLLRFSGFAQIDAFENFKKNSDSTFETLQKNETECLNRYKENINRMWGTYQSNFSTSKIWVEYNPDLNSRSLVDFENGTIEVEVLVDATTSEIDLRKRIKREAVRLVKSKGNTREFKEDTNKPVTNDPILQGQIVTDKGVRIDEKNAEDLVELIIKQKVINKVVVTGGDNKKRTKATITIKLAPDHIKTRAEGFLPYVQKYSEKYKIAPSLILAIIHNESYFNPKAHSWANAHGLMQVVPSSGGADAYSYITGVKQQPTAEMLYQPNKNIEIGVAYMHLLNSRWFKKVENEENRTLCAISAYNTGAGNVSKAFIGSTRLSKAIPEINKLSPDKMYNYLRTNLPYDETKKYLKKVVDSEKEYSKWLDANN